MKQILIYSFSIIITSTFAQTKEKFTNIEIELTKCLNKKDISNAEMCNCIIAARNEWDKELNKYYKLLMSKLTKEASQDLKLAQKNWITYRDKEFKFISRYYYEEKEGTMWFAVSEERKMELVKDRAIELIEYYETLEY
jgi:uncharacterized protein YecT (DUF1311 family)